MNRDKELYRQLRTLRWEELWRREVPRFNQASAKERSKRVAIVRAVGVVFSEVGTREDYEAVKTWLRSLLNDPAEKIRRYAAAAIPKIGAEAVDESALLEVLRATNSPREKQHIAEALGKIGGNATLATGELSSNAEQRLKARGAAGSLNTSPLLRELSGFKVNLWGRAGLEGIVAEEAAALLAAKFQIETERPGLVTLAPAHPFSLDEIFRLRCFGFVGFALQTKEKDAADLITSGTARGILKTFTTGTIRYRLEFVSKGHQRGAVRELAARVYAKAPDLLNTGAGALWTVAIDGESVELRPKMIPDPRFAYRRRDVPAASHPPLAACMARLGFSENDVIWDPFCGSGLELIERSLLGGVRKVIGTDRSAEAIAITAANFDSAGVKVERQLVCSDFREFNPGKVTLIVTNPPMGKRVPIANLRRLIEDLFHKAAAQLVSGGRLVFANPLRLECPERSLKLEFASVVDFGGFDCRLEKYVKTG